MSTLIMSTLAQNKQKGLMDKTTETVFESDEPESKGERSPPTTRFTIPQNDVDDDGSAKREKRDSSSPSSANVSLIRLDRKFISETQEYDREEAVTTKLTRVLKKRPNRPVVPGSESSDLAVERTTLAQPAQAPSIGNPSRTGDDSLRDSILTDVTDMSSVIYSSSSVLDLQSEESKDPSKHSQAGRSLGSGLAFIYMVIPPDGGWGWIILIVSFLAQVIVDGIITTIGVLLPHMAKDFDVAPSKIVLIAAVQIGCYFLGGATSGVLINTYGFRPIAMMGVILASSALFVSTFCQSMTMMIISFSIIGGQGLSMIWASSQLIIGYYFERYRPIANGASCSGAGAGMVVFSVMDYSLVTHFGWRTTTRIHVILLLLIFFMAITYVEVTPVPVGVVKNPLPTPGTSSDEYYGTVHNFFGDNHSPSRVSILEPYTEKKKSSCRRFLTKCCCCCFCCRRQKRESRKVDRESIHSPSIVDDRYVVKRDPLQRQDIYYTGRPNYTERHSKEQVEGREMELVGSDKQMAAAAYGLSTTHEYDAEKRRDRSFRARHPRLTWLSPKTWLHPKIRRAFNLLFDFNLFKQFEFRFLVASAFLYPMGFNIPFVYAKERTSIPPEYAMMIAPAIGITNFLMRICCGFIAYWYRPLTGMICGGGLFFGGSMVLLSAFYGQNLVWFQFVYGLCYGVAPAVYSTLRAILYVRYLGLSKLTNAFGITALAMGLGVFIGTWFGGVLNGVTGGYAAAFAFAGVCIMSSGLVILLLPRLVARRQAKAEAEAAAAASASAPAVTSSNNATSI